MVVLLISSGAWANIAQIQTWDYNLGSNVSVLSGQGTAGTIQGVGGLNVQYADQTTNTGAIQGAGALLVQVGRATGEGALVGITQNSSALAVGATIDGTAYAPGQSQTIYDFIGPGSQYEGVSVHADPSSIPERLRITAELIEELVPSVAIATIGGGDPLVSRRDNHSPAVFAVGRVGLE